MLQNNSFSFLVMNTEQQNFKLCKSNFYNKQYLLYFRIWLCFHFHLYCFFSAIFHYRFHFSPFFHVCINRYRYNCMCELRIIMKLYPTIRNCFANCILILKFHLVMSLSFPLPSCSTFLFLYSSQYTSVTCLPIFHILFPWPFIFQSQRRKREGVIGYCFKAI